MDILSCSNVQYMTDRACQKVVWQSMTLTVECDIIFQQTFKHCERDSQFDIQKQHKLRASLHTHTHTPTDGIDECSVRIRRSLALLQCASVLWSCWLGGKKCIRPVKNWVVGCWHGYLGWGADLHIAKQMPLPLTISCSSKSKLVLPSWFYLSGTSSPG